MAKGTKKVNNRETALSILVAEISNSKSYDLSDPAVRKRLIDVCGITAEEFDAKYPPEGSTVADPE